MSNFNNVSVNCAQYQVFKVPQLTSFSFNQSIELRISYVSLKSDNISCVEMSYVLASLEFISASLRVQQMIITGGGANMIGPDRVKKIRVEMFMVEISGVEKVLKYSILQSVIFGI